MRTLHSFALIPILACIDPTEPPPDVEPIPLVQQTCAHCGPNGAQVDGHPFSWIALDGSESEGVKFLEFRKNNQVVELDVDKTVLRYRDGTGWHWGSNLVGGAMRVAIGDKKYDVFISSVHCDATGGIHCATPGIPYWTETPSGTAETYKLTWVNPDPKSGERLEGDVCPYDAVEELSGGHLKEALVFEGDHYNVDTRDISASAMGPETRAPFNIACVGSLPFKMELARRTEATKNDTYQTTIADDRQALARAWAAEYCRGQVFTETGHLLRIMDKRGWLPRQGWGWNRLTPILNPKFTYEAVWDADGAVCVEKPRLGVPDPIGSVEESVVWQWIKDRCPKGDRPPRCSDQPWFPRQWKEHGQFITANIAWEERGR